MADASKARQLLAAKKMLKDYRKSKKSKSSENQTTERKTPTESLTNSTHSSLNEAPIATVNDEIPIQSISPLQNYFNSELQSSNFFDSINKDETQREFDSFHKINFGGLTNDIFITNNQKDTNYGTPEPFSENVDLSSDDKMAMEDPEINPNEIYNRLHKVENSDTSLENNLQLDSNSVNLNDNLIKKSQLNDISKPEDNMETLKQLSTQIIQLIDDNVPQNDKDCKTDDLVTSFQAEKELNQRLKSQLHGYEYQIVQLENAFQAQKENVDRYNGELIKMQEQLQCHQQTINILVGEKSELSNLILKNESLAKEKTKECDELNARLKTSRSRVISLENELSTLKVEKAKYDKKGLEQNEEYIELTNEVKMLKNQREETLQDVSELQEKLHSSTTENLKLQHEVQNLTSQLSLVNVKIQQLSSAGNSQFDNQVESLIQQTYEFENQITKLNNVIKALNNEKDQAGNQYQQYVQQLNGQLSNLAQKLEVKMKENEYLVDREQQLTKQMSDLEKLLQKVQNERETCFNRNNNGNKQDIENAIISLKNLEKEKAILEENYNQLIQERDDLYKDLEIKNEKLIQLEELVQQVQSDQPDNVKLLATMESDKVAAARAVAQNTELKKQLEEMQEVFIKMSNDKLELTEKLDREQRRNKEICDNLSQFESQIHTLTDAIEIKDREMITLRESAIELNKYMLQQNQLEDRLRHYEAHDHSTHALQHELQESYKRIQALKIENEKLTTSIENINKMQTKKLNSISNSQSTNDNENNLQTEHVVQDSSDTAKIVDVVDSKDDKMLPKEIAMLQLEEKFTKTMQDIANLQDEKQKLEHLVLQLQDETETIGEYVTLYQHQRGILKQRALEREEQMQQLSLDRQQIKNKLDKLNELIKTLVIEKGMVLPECFEQTVNKQVLCDEHAKIQQEFKVPQQNGTYTSTEDNNNIKTAEKIIELLGEIKTSNLVQPSDTSETFHPCPWCSGQLITV